MNKTDLAPYVGVDVPRMVQDAARVRDGRPVLALSRSDPASLAALRAWVLETAARVAQGGHLPTDPGPMAPHSHRHPHDPPHDHAHDHAH